MVVILRYNPTRTGCIQTEELWVVIAVHDGFAIIYLSSSLRYLNCFWCGYSKEFVNLSKCCMELFTMFPVSAPETRSLTSTWKILGSSATGWSLLLTHTEKSSNKKPGAFPHAVRKMLSPLQHHAITCRSHSLCSRWSLLHVSSSGTAT